jgi:hypothetical protein
LEADRSLRSHDKGGTKAVSPATWKENFFHHGGHRERRGSPFSGDTEIGKSPIAVAEIKKEFVGSEFFCEAMEFYPGEHLSRAEINLEVA